MKTPNRAAVLAAPLGPLAAHSLTRVLPLAPSTVPKSTDRRTPPLLPTFSPRLRLAEWLAVAAVAAVYVTTLLSLYLRLQHAL